MRTLPDETGEADASTRPFLHHLIELRRTVVWVLVLLGFGMLLCAPLAPRVLDLLKVPLREAGQDPSEFLWATEIAGGFRVALRIILWTGVLASMPFTTIVVARFIFPGLTRLEKRAVVRMGFFSVLLFIAGVCLCYFLTLPVGLEMMFRVNRWMGIECRFTEIGNYIGFALRLLIAFGIAFELPVVVLVLGALGIITSQQLRSKRRHVIVGLAAVAMIMTPPDFFTQILMAAPLVVLYELCIWTLWYRERRRDRRQA